MTKNISSRNEIILKNYIETKLRQDKYPNNLNFWYTKNLSKSDFKTSTILCLSKNASNKACPSCFNFSSIKDCIEKNNQKLVKIGLEKVHRNEVNFKLNKARWKNVEKAIFYSSKLYWTKYVKVFLFLSLSKVLGKKCLKTTSIFPPPKFHWESTSKWCGNLLIFWVGSIDLISTSSRRWSDLFHHHYIIVSKIMI